MVVVKVIVILLLIYVLIGLHLLSTADKYAREFEDDSIDGLLDRALDYYYEKEYNKLDKIILYCKLVLFMPIGYYILRLGDKDE